MPYTPRYPLLQERYLRYVETADVSEEQKQALDEWLSAIIEHCTNYCGQPLLETEEQHTLNGEEKQAKLSYNRVPVAFVGQFSQEDALATPIPVTGQQFAIDRTPGVLFLSFSGTVPGNRIVKLRVGYTEATLPEDIKQLFVESLAIAWKKGENRLGQQSVTQSLQGGNLTRVFTSLDKRKKSVLGPYKLPTL
jgi:hypothetical protein